MPAGRPTRPSRACTAPWRGCTHRRKADGVSEKKSQRSDPGSTKGLSPARPHPPRLKGSWRSQGYFVAHLALVLGQLLPCTREELRLLRDRRLALKHCRVRTLLADLVAEPAIRSKVVGPREVEQHRSKRAHRDANCSGTHRKNGVRGRFGSPSMRSARFRLSPSRRRVARTVFSRRIISGVRPCRHSSRTAG